jgi:hypothetical protein
MRFGIFMAPFHPPYENAYTRRSMEWVQKNRGPFLAAATQGMLAAIEKDRAERGQKALAG